MLRGVAQICGLGFLGWFSFVGSSYAQDSQLDSQREAQSESDYGVTASVEAPFPAGSPEDPTLSATVVDTTDRSRVGEELGQVFDEIPGASIRSTGGLGSFTGLSIRGADLAHTNFVFGNTPLTSIGGAAFDLSSIPLSLIGRVEVYRSGAPLSIAMPSIGGVVRLVPREPEQYGEPPEPMVEGSFTGGSFGHLGLNFLASVPNVDGPSWLSLVGFRHSRGDYPYLDNANTPLIEGDDEVRNRQNGEVDEGYGLARIEIPTESGSFEVLALAQARRGGLTGSPIEEPIHTRRNQMRLLTSVAYRREFGSEPEVDSDSESHADLDADWERPTRFSLHASASMQSQSISDRFAEINFVPTDTHDRSSDLDIRAYVEHRLLDRLTLGAAASYHFGYFAPSDALATNHAPSSNRHTATVGSELRLQSGSTGLRYELRGTLALEGSRAELVEIRAERFGEHYNATNWAPTARLGFAVEPHPGIALSTSVGTATRLPSMVELFGDGAFLLGDARLSPERSIHVDAGILISGETGLLDGRLELRAFGLLTDNLIRYVRTAQFRLVPQNTAEATVWGVEVGGHLEIGQHFGITGTLSYLRTKDPGEDRELPLRPRLESFARPEVSFRPSGFVSRIRIYAELTHVGSNFTDPRNQVRIPPRTLFSSGFALEFINSRIGLSASVQDIADVRPFDLVGFPLPGRRFFVEISLRNTAE